MKVSIAMCTYNGAAYLQQQLDSIAAQTRQPDELVVCDDNSEDDSVEMVRAFAGKASFKVKITKNRINIGYIRNFDQAIRDTSGDVVFLCDQDDVWIPEKIERICAEFERKNNALLIINDQEITFADLRSSGRTSMENMERVYGDISRFMSGCCSAFRSELKEVLLPIPHSLSAHDVWLHEVAALMECRHGLRETLQLYRRHEAAVSKHRVISTSAPAGRRVPSIRLGVDPRSHYQRRAAVLKLISRRARSLPMHSALSRRVDMNRLDRRIGAELHALECRRRLIGARGMRRQLLACQLYVTGQYRYFEGWKSFAKDLIRPALKEV